MMTDVGCRMTDVETMDACLPVGREDRRLKTETTIVRCKK